MIKVSIFPDAVAGAIVRQVCVIKYTLCSPR